MKYLDAYLRDRIDRKRKQLDRLRPLPVSAVKKLRAQFQIEMTYNSNGIEGNTLTLKETYLVINEGVTVKNKPLKDHLEAKDHYEALQFVADLVERDKRHTLSERLVRTLHQLVTKDTEREWAGKYRNSDVMIGGAFHKPPNAVRVPEKMNDLIQWFGNHHAEAHPVEVASILHHKLVHIHPFFDGNGRVGRLLMNVALMKHGYPLAVILKNDRKKYYDRLAKADKGDYGPLVRFVAQSVERSLDIYLKALSPGGDQSERFIILSEASRKTPYSAKYLNLLARQGKLEAHKEGRNWLVSPEAVQRYVQSRQRKR